MVAAVIGYCIALSSQADYHYSEINDKLSVITLKLGDAKVCTYVHIIYIVYTNIAFSLY